MQFETPKAAKPIKITAGQRKILADRVRHNAAEKIKALRESIPQQPDLENFITQYILSGTLKIKTQDEILDNLQRHVSHRGMFSSNSVINIPYTLIFERPEEYDRLKLEYDRKYNEVQTKIRTICAERDQICMKIEVGSIEALQQLIFDIDRVGGELRLTEGNQSLLLTSGEEGDDGPLHQVPAVRAQLLADAVSPGQP